MTSLELSIRILAFIGIRLNLKVFPKRTSSIMESGISTGLTESIGYLEAIATTGFINTNGSFISVTGDSTVVK